MEYTYVETFSGKEKSLEDQVEEKRIQIATNLMVVHNLFSKAKIISPEMVYAFEVFENIDEDKKGAFQPFFEIADSLCEMDYATDTDMTMEEMLKKYERLENKLKEAMKKV